MLDDDSYEWNDDLWRKHTYKRHVGNYMMRIYYRDPNIPHKIEELAAPAPKETQTYIGTVQWTKYSVDRLGNKGLGEINTKEVNFLAYRISRRVKQLRENNQIIETLHISANVTRQIEKRETHEWIAGSTYGRPVKKDKEDRSLRSSRQWRRLVWWWRLIKERKRSNEQNR